eukprot:scaffold7369_cov61-Phaeocystis_antarctica.AAC.7
MILVCSLYLPTHVLTYSLRAKVPRRGRGAVRAGVGRRRPRRRGGEEGARRRPGGHGDAHLL